MAENLAPDNSRSQLESLREAIDSGRLSRVRRLLAALPSAEIADLLESMPKPLREVAWELVDPEQDGEVLVHLNDEVRLSLIREMDSDELVKATADLDVDDLADLLEDLPEAIVDSVLQSMDRENRDRLTQVLAYPEDSAGGLMTLDVITVRREVSLDVVLRYLRIRGELPAHLEDLFVVDRNGRYLGRVAIADLLTKDPTLTVADVFDAEAPALDVNAAANQVAQQFEYYDWVSAPVIDEDGKLLGRITVDDIVDVIREEGEHTVMSMSGLDEDDDMFAPVFRSMPRRATWLGINLLTALLAAWFIGRFEAALEQVVALAILMPVVASMGGIAGTQTLTLMIRGLAVGQVSGSNAVPLLNRELALGALNGLLWALVLAAIAVAWFGDSELAVVIGVAIVLNLVAAAIAGVIIPLVLRRMGIDPALAGGVVLTTVTDVVGFVAFLGMGTWLLL